MDEELSEKEAVGDTNESEGQTREDQDEDDISTGKRSKHSKKHRHKHSKKHKHKHKKRKHKKRLTSRSRSRSSSRSRSKSPDSNGEEFEDQLQSNKITEEEMKVAFSKENGTVNQEMRNKAKASGGEAEDWISEDIVLDDCENSTSFKLTKSPARSVSPKEPGLKPAMVKALEVPNVENKVNLGFPFKIGLFSKSKSKSPDRRSRSRSGSPSDSKNKEKLESASDPKIKKRSRSPSDSKIEKRSRSPSDRKIKKHSRSHSRSRSQSRKSKSKSPRKYDSKKKSRSKSRSRSHSKHRSRSHSKSRSRSPQKHKRKSRSHSRSSSYSRKKSRKERSRGRSVSVKSRSRSPRKKERTSYSSKTRGRNRSRSPSYKDRRSRCAASPRRNRRSTSYERKQCYGSRSRRMRSRSPKRRYSRRSRSRSDTRERSRQHRSHSRSPRRGRSRTPSRDRCRHRSRSGSKSKRYRRRSRSRSFSPRKKKSKSRSRSRDRHQRRSRSRSKSKERNDNKGNNNTAKENVVTSTTITTVNAIKPSAQDLVGKAPIVSDPSNKRSLAELTEFCKKLTEARGIETEGNEKENKIEEEEDAEVEISHPFLVAPKKDITIPQVIFPVRALPPPLVSSDKPLTEQFPVSCGTKHHEKEEEETGKNLIIPHIDGSAVQTQQVFQAPQNHEKLDISGLVVKRMDAQRRLQVDPNDVDAMLSLQEVEMKLNNWCQSNVKPGQFTGQLAKTMMPKEKFNSGYQAWAKKDMFHNLNPVSGGIGMKLLQKMGWQPGQVLGKRGEGMAEPIALTVKVDRKGLSSNAEKPVGKKAGNKPIIDLQGKHPISSLQEYCARRKWQVPEFTLIFDEGPPHSKQFLFKVAVNGYEYQHPVVSSNKKHAKAQAAVAALKGLGLVPEDAEY